MLCVQESEIMIQLPLGDVMYSKCISSHFTARKSGESFCSFSSLQSFVSIPLSYSSTPFFITLPPWRAASDCLRWLDRAHPPFLVSWGQRSVTFAWLDEMEWSSLPFVVIQGITKEEISPSTVHVHRRMSFIYPRDFDVFVLRCSLYFFGSCASTSAESQAHKITPDATSTTRHYKGHWKRIRNYYYLKLYPHMDAARPV